MVVQQAQVPSTLVVVVLPAFVAATTKRVCLV
jgi:hypothetical protein